ncbi:hypothetical protein [Armatimonas sp.]|uniref:hypothetical protein n=1 Tax=Armatimonas sp. TaxID=1872638 RepID=UPI00375335F8
MRWEPTGDDAPNPSSFAELTELRYFSWGYALSGISDDPRLPGRYVLILRDTTPDAEPSIWFVFTTATEHHNAELNILGYGNNDTQGAGVPTKPRPPRRPASNAVALEW